MWVCLNSGFVSIVENHFDKNTLLVRARRRQDVQNFLDADVGKYPITETLDSDYRFRAVVPREELAIRMVKHIAKINYGNFKDSTKNGELQRFYGEVWASGIRNLDPDWPERHY